MKVIQINETGIEFDDGTSIIDNHMRDCCEVVYADWKSLRDTDIMQHEFVNRSIVGVKDSGFRLGQYFVPCYNDQNGYYSSNLELIITDRRGNEKIINISDYVADKIN